MVRVGNAHIWGGSRGDIGNDIVINLAVISVKPKVYRNVWVQRLEILDGFLVNRSLGFVGVVFCPEGNLIILGGIEFLRDGEGLQSTGAVTAGEHQHPCKHQGEHQPFSEQFSHPFVPPLATPAIIFLRKIKKRIISGREITTTAAIIAGIFSRPKPFSRISWIPLDTR